MIRGNEYPYDPPSRLPIIIGFAFVCLVSCMCFCFYMVFQPQRGQAIVICEWKMYQAVQWDFSTRGIRFWTPDGRYIIIRGDYILEEE